MPRIAPPVNLAQTDRLEVERWLVVHGSKRCASLSITRISFGEEVTEVNVMEAGEAAPEDLVAGRRIVGACEVAAELGEFEGIRALMAGFWHHFRVRCFFWGGVAGGVVATFLTHRLLSGIPAGMAGGLTGTMGRRRIDASSGRQRICEAADAVAAGDDDDGGVDSGAFGNGFAGRGEQFAEPEIKRNITMCGTSLR